MLAEPPVSDSADRKSVVIAPSGEGPGSNVFSLAGLGYRRTEESREAPPFGHRSSAEPHRRNHSRRSLREPRPE